MDDSPDVVAYLTALLEDNGMAVITAYNGDDALEKASREQPDLITLDIQLPGISGLQVIRRLREDSATATIPVFVVTGEMDEVRLKARIAAREPEGFFRKPIDREVLLTTVDNVLTRAVGDKTSN